MQRMKKEEIQHLAALARIRLSDEEVTQFETELSSIVQYVSAVQSLASDEDASEPELGVRYNVFRKDEVTNEPDQYTDAALQEMPQTSGRFMEVKKILKTDD